MGILIKKKKKNVNELSNILVLSGVLTYLGFQLDKGQRFRSEMSKNLFNWSGFSFKRIAWHGELCWLDTESNIAVAFTQAAGLNDNLIT